MVKRFNTTGPCHEGRHYMLPPMGRIGGLEKIVSRGDYFVIHAARQSGKTTLLQAFKAQLNATGKYHAVYCSLEALQNIDDPLVALPSVAEKIASACATQISGGLAPGSRVREEDFSSVVTHTISRIAGSLVLPLVLLFDEADCLGGTTFIGFLRQLREGYIMRGDMPFASSVALVGMRNIRDFKARVRADSDTLGSASPFNIVAETFTLRNFTRDETAALYAQHTADTGQVFEPEAVDRAFHWSQGQPWLVNAMAREAVEKILLEDFTRPVTAPLMDEVAEILILRRDTHLDSLLERLKEDRVRSVIEPVITGDAGEIKRLSDDFLYTRDLGLIRDDGGTIRPANPLYTEVILRTLTFDQQQTFNPAQTGGGAGDYSRPGGGLDMDRMLAQFQQFWRENSAIWVERFDYKEAAPHLVLMAFLQRVINGGGRIAREMAAETGRLDLCVEWGTLRYPVEIKVRRTERTEAEGLDQIARYMESLGLHDGWLVVFDRRKEVPWDRKISSEIVERDSRRIHVIRS